MCHKEQEKLKEDNDLSVAKLAINLIKPFCPPVDIISSVVAAKEEISNRAITQNLIKFIENIDNVSIEDQEYWIEVNEGKEEENGTRLMMIITNLDDSRKAELAGHLYSYCIKNHLKKETLFRVIYMISKSYFEDFEALKEFRKHDSLINNNKFISTEIVGNLFSYGFLKDVGIDGGDFSSPDSGGTVYSLNQYGKILSDIID